ncbi:Uma2 family endonuclease [Leptolyngbyaceae cyanobacterium UHCC 1019]
MIAVPQPHKMTADAYLTWEAQQETRHEYLDGEILAMTGGTLSHNQLALNLYSSLRPQLQPKGCRAFVADAKVNVTKINAYFYPDLVVSCHPEDLAAQDAITHPTLIVEVLSPSTRDYDRGDKFKSYHALSSLQEYVLIDTTQVAIEYFRWGEGRMWLHTFYEAGETIALHSLGIEVAVDVIYEEVRLNFDRPTEAEN